MTKLSSIPVFYTTAMLAQPNSFSPSAQKPEHVLSAWQAAGLPSAVSGITPATEYDLCFAHDPAFVRGVLDQTVENGFGDTSPDVAASLPYVTLLDSSMRRVISTSLPFGRSRGMLPLGISSRPTSLLRSARTDSPSHTGT